MKNLTALLILFNLLLVTVVCAQPYYFRHYQVENGLSNNAVLCSMQDQRGFMWFGTKDGLNRFDGYSFKVFHSDPDNPNGLGSNFIRSLCEDKTGNIWIGTDQGIFIFNPRSESFSLFDDKIINEVLEIQQDDDGDIWFINDFQLYRYDVSKQHITQITSNSQFNCSSFQHAGNNKIWIGTTKGDLLEYNKKKNNFVVTSLYSHSPSVETRWIESIYNSKQGYLLIGTTKQGVKKFDIESRSYQDIFIDDKIGSDIFVRDIMRHSRHEYWFATEAGIFIYNITTNQFTNLKKQRGHPWAISDNAIYTLCKDREGGIWAGTYFGGINYYEATNTFFEKYFPHDGRNGIFGNAVRELVFDNHNNLWIGTEDDGLNKLHLPSGEITHYSASEEHHSISFNNIHGLLASGDSLWIGTFEHGLDLMDIPSGKVIKHYSVGTEKGTLSNNFIFNIYKTRKQQILLATGSGLLQYNQVAQTFHYVPGFPEHLFYTTIFEDSNGIIWAGTWRDGLYYFNPKTGASGEFTHQTNDNKSLGSNRVNRIFEDHSHNLWIATEGGLCLFNAASKTFERYTTNDGFPSNLILAMLEDDNHYLWITTSKGLVRFHPESEDIQIFTKANGLLSDQFNYNSALKSSQGDLYFGSVKGLIKFNPINYRKSNYHPPVYITGIQIHNQDLEIEHNSRSILNQSITYTDHIYVKHDQSSLSIDFAALSYVSPLMTEYAYKMEGLDDKWTHIRTNRRAYFTKLAPGEYTFRVNVTDGAGSFKGKETQLHITVTAPIWATHFAYVIYVLLIASITWYLIHNYHSRIKERNRRKLELIRHRKEEEVYRAKIDFFTNVTHEIRTPLTLIKAPLEKVIKKTEEQPLIQKHLQTMDRNTDRLLELTDQLLDFRKIEVQGYQLNYVKVNLNELLTDNYQRFKMVAAQKNIRLKLELPNDKCMANVDKEAVTQIISNLLTNGLKYAKRAIIIQLHEQTDENNMLTISVKNDGHIIPAHMREAVFDTFVRLKEGENQQGSGLGLALARSFAQLHNGKLYLIHPEDDMNVFILKLPLIQKNRNTNGKDTANETFDLGN